MTIQVIKFSATWCGPCRVVKENLKDVENIKDVDIEENMELAAKYNVRKIPMLIFFKNDVEVHRHSGVITKEQYLALVTEINDSKEL